MSYMECLNFFEPVNRFKEYYKANKAGEDKECCHHTLFSLVHSIAKPGAMGAEAHEILPLPITLSITYDYL